MKRAFTLAEVLITLGIIGVVAALTVPALINNYNTKSWNTATSVFDKKLEDALKTMNAQSTLTGHTTTESFVEELSKHFKTNKICNNDKLLDCFSETVYWNSGEAAPEAVDINLIKTVKNFGQNDWKTNIVGVQFANGTSALIAYNPTDSCVQNPHSNQIDTQNCLAILYDVSGDKNPNTIGKDLRSNKNVKSLGTGCAFELDGTCYTTMPFNPTPMTFEECTGYNATHSGTNVDTPAGGEALALGIKGCHFPNDYWAGAVKTCGGLNKMASQSDLQKIVSYVYSDGAVDSNKLSELGLPSPNFYVWAGSEHSAGSANRMYFTSENASWRSSYRYNAAQLAICVE